MGSPPPPIPGQTLRRVSGLNHLVEETTTFAGLNLGKRIWKGRGPFMMNVFPSFTFSGMAGWSRGGFTLVFLYHIILVDFVPTTQCLQNMSTFFGVTHALLILPSEFFKLGYTYKINGNPYRQICDPSRVELFDQRSYSQHYG